MQDLYHQPCQASELREVTDVSPRDGLQNEPAAAPVTAGNPTFTSYDHFHVGTSFLVRLISAGLACCWSYGGTPHQALPNPNTEGSRTVAGLSGFDGHRCRVVSQRQRTTGFGFRVEGFERRVWRARCSG